MVELTFGLIGTAASDNLMKFCCHGGKLPVDLAMKILQACDNQGSSVDSSESES